MSDLSIKNTTMDKNKKNKKINRTKTKKQKKDKHKKLTNVNMLIIVNRLYNKCVKSELSARLEITHLIGAFVVESEEKREEVVVKKSSIIDFIHNASVYERQLSAASLKRYYRK